MTKGFGPIVMQSLQYLLSGKKSLSVSEPIFCKVVQIFFFGCLIFYFIKFFRSVDRETFILNILARIDFYVEDEMLTTCFDEERMTNFHEFSIMSCLIAYWWMRPLFTFATNCISSFNQNLMRVEIILQMQFSSFILMWMQACRSWGCHGTPVFGRSVYPISTSGTDYAHHNTSGPLRIFRPYWGPDWMI